MKGTINLSIILLLLSINLIIKKNDVKFQSKDVFIFLLILLFTISTILINGDQLFDYIIFYIVLISAFFFSRIFSFETFIHSYVKIIYFISVFSLLTFTVLVVAPSLLEIFPKYTNSVGLNVNNIFFSVTYNSTYFKSNYGLFWEPGAYQTFLNISLFLELFIFEKIDVKRIIVLIVTILTTFSTTGYIGMILLIITYLVSITTINSNNIKVIAVIIIAGISGFFLISLLPDNIIFKLFGKLEILYNSSIYNNSSYISTNIRMNSVKAVISSFIKNPFFGVGFSNLNKASYYFGGEGMLTATPLNWFGLYGAVVGVILNYPLWSWTKFINKPLYIRLLVFSFFIIIFLTENYTRNLFYLCFLFIGLSTRKKKNEEK